MNPIKATYKPRKGESEEILIIKFITDDVGILGIFIKKDGTLGSLYIDRFSNCEVQVIK